MLSASARQVGEIKTVAVRLLLVSPLLINLVPVQVCIVLESEAPEDKETTVT
jgi:hypothetical protein